MKYLAILSTSLVVAQPALAQGASENEITVVAAGLPQQVDRTGQSISIVGAEEIEAVQGPDLSRVLERLPGVTLTRNGGLGGFTGLRVRGANAEQVLVLVDGIRVADVAAPGGGYDFGNLAASGLEKVELLRGSNSVVWGSEAIGGVVALTSKKIEGVEAAAEYGARDSFDGQVNGGIAGDGYGLSAGGGYTRTDGFSQAAVGTEPDGWRQWRAHGRGYIGLTDRLTAKAAARYSDSRLDIDGYPAPDYTFADTPEFQQSREMNARAGLDYVDETLVLDGGFQLSDTRREYVDPTFGPAPYYATKGRAERAEIKGNWTPIGLVRIDFGADHEWSRFADSDGTEKARLASGHVLAGWYGRGFALAAGLRIDDHSRFGSEWTFGANGSYALSPDLRLRASYGEGFKVPTLYQLFSDYGNGALAPERSKSYDAGIEYGNRNGRFHAALTAFRRDTANLIDYVSCFSVADPLCEDGRFGFYANVGKARAQGIEIELAAQLSERFRAQAAYTLLDAADRTPGGASRGNELARRPRHAVTVSADWHSPLAGLTLGGDVRMVSDSFDDAGNFTPIDGHALVTVRASLPVNEAFEIYGRVENLAGVEYRTVAGYGTPGRSAFVGARARF
ncbi:TonB-dependent receptor [Novosphingobium marinum]|uniref:Vitamin B12 transporter n=1 Tax=Novosphingobium marinum TaxID=1514948 RepID=A0A7Y9XVL1_9SPHN|nr:TonB-dependent receptor [Novosphingobium marinum]NYH95352.1 vitamin B12 transporter [Novosphingobium marinum]GGC26351.1 TonB-dependent receptor [Novosphingobium marinum]